MCIRDRYTSGPEAPLAQPEWPGIAAAAAGGDLTFTVEAMAQAAPGTKHVSAPVRLTVAKDAICLLYTSPSPRDRTRYRMPSSA